MIEGGLVLRLRSAAECVDLGLALLRTDAGIIVRAILPWGILFSMLLLAVWYWNPFVGVPLALGLGGLLQAPVVQVVAARAIGAVPTWGFRSGAAAIWRLGLFSALPTLVATLSFLIPPVALITWSYLSFLPEILLVEQHPQPYKRLLALNQRGSGRSLVARFWMVMVVMYAGLAAELSAQFLIKDVFQAGAPWGSLMDGAITPFFLLGLMFSFPLWALIRFSLYLDNRTRSESLDVFFALWTASQGRGR